MKPPARSARTTTVDAEATLAFTLDTLWELTDRLGSGTSFARSSWNVLPGEQPEDPLRIAA